MKADPEDLDAWTKLAGERVADADISELVRVTGGNPLLVVELGFEQQIRHAKDAPISEVPTFRKMLRVTRLPLPLRRFAWLIGLNFGRQRANFFGSFVVTSVAAYGAGELHALSPGPFILSYGVVEPNQTIDVVIRWDHRITDAALIAKASFPLIVTSSVGRNPAASGKRHFLPRNRPPMTRSSRSSVPPSVA